MVRTTTPGTAVREGRQRTPDDRAAWSPAPSIDWYALPASEHVVQFYETDGFLQDSVSAFIGAGLGAGEAALVVATPAHRAGLEERMLAAGLNLAGARASGQYVVLDAAETLALFMLDGMPDSARFAEVLGGAIAQAATGRQRVRIFGEMVALLGAAGNHAAAIRLEELWNQLHATRTFVLLCAYPIQDFGGEALAKPLGDVCAMHARVIPAESYTALTDSGDRMRAVIQLQQQARSLEAEIVERKAAEAALRQALQREQAVRAEAQEAVRLRDLFLSIAAHELKTPITSLFGNAQLLLRRAEREGTGASQPSKAVRVIAEQARRLNKMVLALLDVSRIETGWLSIERAPVDLCALARRVVDEVQPALDKHSIECRTPSGPLLIVGDELRLEQVLQNLLANAVKYSPRGGSVVVRVEQHEHQARMLVSDAGIGIPTPDQPHLFQRFYRASNADTQYMSGMGLGLYVVKEIICLHGGMVAVESDEGAGSTFTVSLPLGEEHASA